MAVADVPVGHFPVRLSVLALFVAGMVLVLIERAYRVFEVHMSGLILSVITSSGTEVVGDRETFYFGLSGDTSLGLRMTPECSSIFMLLPLLLVAAVMVWFRPQNSRTLFSSLAIAAVAVVIVNQLRVLAIFGLVNWLGVDTGYYWGHTLLGSMVSVIGGAGTLVLFVWLSTRRRA